MTDCSPSGTMRTERQRGKKNPMSTYPEAGDTIRFIRHVNATPKSEMPDRCQQGWGPVDEAVNPLRIYTSGCKCGQCKPYGTPEWFTGTVVRVMRYSDAVEAIVEYGEETQTVKLAHVSEGWNWGHETKSEGWELA